MVDIDAHIDDKSKRFLQTVEWHGGSATTTEIRERTGLNQSETQYRFKKLSKAGLIQISHEERGYGSRRPPRVAELTAKGETAIEDGLLDDIDATTATTPKNIERRTVEQLQEDIERLEDQVELFAHAGTGTGRSQTADGQPSVITNRFDAIETRVTEVEEEIETVADLEERVTALEDDVNTLRGYTYELADEFELRMAAAQDALEDQLNIDLSFYIERIKSPVAGAENSEDGYESD